MAGVVVAAGGVGVLTDCLPARRAGGVQPPTTWQRDAQLNSGHGQAGSDTGADLHAGRRET